MSSGVEADIALDAAVILSLGLNRVLGGAAGLAAGGTGALAALAQGKAEAREAALLEATRHEETVRAALDVNARIGALDAAQRRAAADHGVPADVALPEPLGLDGRTAEELTAWTTETDAALNEAERAMSANIAAAVAGQIFAVPAEALHTALPPGEQGKVAEALPDLDDRAATLARVLRRVLPDTAEADHGHIAEAAERLATARTAGEAEGLLVEVRLRVQAANERTLRSRAETRRLAEERRAVRQAEAERRYVLDAITTAFGEMGYEVDAGFETLTAQDGAILLTKGDWPQHAVKMRVDERESAQPPSAEASGRARPKATLRAAMVRDGVPQSEEERRVDIEREREWCDAFEEARARLATAGVHSDVRWRIEPGVQQLPAAPETQRTRPRAKRRERERERPNDG
jgi:hypothetical protein